MRKNSLITRSLVFGLVLFGALAASPKMMDAEIVREGFPRGASYFEGCCDDSGTPLTKASHTLESQGKIHYYPSYLVDNNLETCWAVKDGRGEWFELALPGSESIPFHGFDLVNGYVKSENSWKLNSRIKTLRVVIEGKPYGEVHLLDTPSIQRVNFPQPHPRFGRVPVRFEVLETYPGSTYDDLCVSEFQLSLGH